MPITTDRRGARVYILGDTFAAKDRIKALGGHWDGDARAWWVGAAKAAEAERLATELTAAPPQRTLDDARVYAKVRYKGRTYYVVAEGSSRCRLTVMDGAIDFWADMAECELLKRYEPREVRSGYGRRSRTEYQTLGGLRRFVEGQRAAEREGLPACAACGKRRADLVHDLEDGLMKCPGCADIPGD